ncbi:histone deacetylase [Opitutus sp. ER46]|nr:histone deacetylase [Opitutus sp. ER46]
MQDERPARATRTAALLHERHPDWTWRAPALEVPDSTLLLAHTASHLRRLDHPEDFDHETPYLPGIGEHARRSVSGALEATAHALEHGTPVFSLMRPPGHHATAMEAMGYCYLNTAAIAALHAVRVGGLKRVAVWDFDAHHGNGTEFILHAQAAHDTFFFASVHQYPGYPGTGTQDHGPSIRNWPVAPRSPRANHMQMLRASLDAVLSFAPDLIVISAGFDAFKGDPVAELSLEVEDFAELGRWVAAVRHPTAAILEGGYSEQLPLLVDAFLSAWQNAARSA